uniref:Uncharacterized protein n=1 Tax=Aegilops tauschii TaxID=37682 RepID=M8C4J9_AEGTA
MATPAIALLDQSLPFGGGGSDRLSKEIFSILESNFLFGAQALEPAGACSAGRVDQAVSMAFGENRATNYIRIQGNGITAGATAEAAMAERGVESVLFRGKKLMPQTNGERLDGVAEQLVREQHRRMDSKTPVVLIKPSATPRTSSSSASTLITVSTNSSSESP